MLRIAIVGLVLAGVTLSNAAKLIDPSKCPNGCKLDEDCVLNSECKLLDVTDSCGFCVCREGYKASGSKCVEIKGYSTSTTSTTTTTEATTTESTTTTTEATTESTTTTTESTTTTTTVPTTTGTTTQSPTPPVPDPVNCADFACTVGPPSDTADENPLQVRSQLITSGPTDSSCKKQLVIPPRPCKMVGGGSCYGIYCLTVSPGNDYCICPYYKTDRQCAVDKPGSCEQATGQIPTGMTSLQGKRFRNPSNKDNGSVYGRHFAATLNDCVKLCQWSKGACRAINYGPINGANVCEMLSTAATSKNLLSTWLEPADGWQYVQLQQAFM